MAGRPPQKGLSYYSNDTDRYQDRKIKKLRKEFGTGIAVWDYVLNEIYREEGSFLSWDEDCAFDVADYFNIKETLVNEIISGCVRVGLFNKTLFNSCSILTSKSIQERYLKICKDAKRKEINILPEFDLINFHRKKKVFPPEEIELIQEEIPINSVDNTQRKEKKRKEKERREKNARALEFLKINFPSRFETEFLMRYKSKIKEPKKFAEIFNDKVDTENLEYTDRILFARLNSFAIYWVENEKKYGKTELTDYESGKLERF